MCYIYFNCILDYVKNSYLKLILRIYNYMARRKIVNNEKGEKQGAQ